MTNTYSPMTLEQQMREINEALLQSSIHQHELTEHAEQAEQALRESNARFESLFDASSVGMYLVDADLRIRLVSRKARPVFGEIGQELIGSSLAEVIHTLWPPESAADIMAQFRHTLATGEPYAAPEFSEVRYDRKVREYYDWQIHRIDLPEGQYGVVCYFIDISARMLAEESRHRLELVTQEQAASLADLHRRKDEFLAMLSHELRNPLAPILNAVQLLQLEKSDSGLQQEARAIIERQVGQLTRLIDDLLEVSRISTGRIHLHVERMDLRRVVERAVETARPAIGQRCHALTVVLPPAPVWLLADSTRLEQVVVNLLNNAAKYTPEGGQIWVGLQLESEEAVLLVRDTGEGIAPEVLPRIFDLFTQAARSLDRSQGGLGIGLALVKTLVGMHHGRVEASSTLGQGSEFTVRLPVGKDEGGRMKDEPEAPLASSSLLPPSSLRVLVVDDNVDAAQALALLLKVSGYATRMAHTGPAALQEADVFQPDVVLLDIGLPQMNGYEVAKQMRQQPRFKDTVLVALTGYGQESDRQLSKEAGFDHHLVKPADFAKLKRILAAAARL